MCFFIVDMTVFTLFHFKYFLSLCADMLINLFLFKTAMHFDIFHLQDKYNMDKNDFGISISNYNYFLL